MIPAALVLAFLVLSSACQPANSLVGFWRSDLPSNLLYEYRADGSVILHDGERQYPVFRYQLRDRDRLVLYDGMGRIMKYRVSFSANRLIFFEEGDPGSVIETFTRQH